MIPVDVTRGARDDLLAISEGLSDFSVRRALNFIDLFERILRDLRDFPDIGRPVPGDEPARWLSRGGYIFVYERMPELTRLLRIIDGRRQR